MKRGVMGWLACWGLLLPQLAYSAPIPFKRDPAPAVAVVGTAVLGVLVVAGLAIGAVLWTRRRLQFKSPARRVRLVQVLESERLGPRAVLSVVAFGGRHHLVVQSEQGVRRLASVSAEQP